MNVNDAFPSKYLKASDLGGKKIKVQIEKVGMEEVGDGRKPVAYFFGKSKGLVLNKTNAMVIASHYGNDMDSWAGSEVHIYSAKVNFQNQMVDSIRVEVVPEVVNEDAEPSF